MPHFIVAQYLYAKIERDSSQVNRKLLSQFEIHLAFHESPVGLSLVFVFSPFGEKNISLMKYQAALNHIDFFTASTLLKIDMSHSGMSPCSSSGDSTDRR